MLAAWSYLQGVAVAWRRGRRKVRAMRTALLGGSFDPPHLGHVLCAAHARIVGGVDAVWLLPVARHAWGKPLAPFAQRLELCRLACADLPFVSVRDDELRNPSGFTWDLLDLLEREHPERSFCLVGGTDTGRDLERWHRGPELVRRLPVLVVPRGGHDAGPAALPAISSTLVRRRLAAGDRCADLLPHTVAERIAACGWYRSAAE
jgi:nicotinate-nucleotide adenylyltransferase